MVLLMYLFFRIYLLCCPLLLGSASSAERFNKSGLKISGSVLLACWRFSIWRFNIHKITSNFFVTLQSFVTFCFCPPYLHFQINTITHTVKRMFGYNRIIKHRSLK